MRLDKPKLYFEEKGAGEPLVFLHGFTLDTRMWDDQFDVFAKSYRVIRFDHRGHGQSEGIKDKYSQSEDVKSLLQSLGIERAHIVGLSMGGMISTAFALENPEMVRSLVLVDSAGTFRPSSELGKRIIDYLAVANSQGFEAGLKEWISDPLFGPANRIASVRERLQEIVLEGHLAQGEGAFFLSSANSISPATPLEERLGDIIAPTAVIVGELDIPEFVENADTFSSRISGATKITIKGAGHMSNMEKPVEFNGILNSFLAAQNN